MSNAIGNIFKKEQIFLATVDIPMEEKEVQALLTSRSIISDEEKIPEFVEKAFLRQEVDIFYKDENGYTRFLMEGNETFAGDGSDGKGKLNNIVSAWDYYGDDELVETVNYKGQPVIAETVSEPMERYNKDYNLK